MKRRASERPRSNERTELRGLLGSKDCRVDRRGPKGNELGAPDDNDIASSTHCNRVRVGTAVS